MPNVGGVNIKYVCSKAIIYVAMVIQQTFNSLHPYRRTKLSGSNSLHPMLESCTVVITQ